MDLQFEDVVNLLHISKNTLEKWMEKKNLPYYTISNKPRFNRQELEEWLMGTLANKGSFSFGAMEDGASTWNRFCLYRAVHKGCVIDGVLGSSKEEIIHSVMKKAAFSLKIHPETVSELLIERENLMSTALGNGIAVPHTRDFLLHDYTDAAVVVYLENQIDWGAIDGSLTDTLIFLFACDDKRHLNLLAKVAHFTMKEQTKDVLKARPSKDKLLEEILAFEKNLTVSSALIS